MGTAVTDLFMSAACQLFDSGVCITSHNLKMHVWHSKLCKTCIKHVFT